MFSESLLNLGRIHWFLLCADKQMTAKRLVPHPPGKPFTVEWTEFGDEVEIDEINWWIFKREHDIPLLRKKTEDALQAAQTLKEITQKLRKGSYQSLDNLTRVYGHLALKHQEEISILLEYTQWLHQKDELAPTILFNYRRVVPGWQIDMSN